MVSIPKVTHAQIARRQQQADGVVSTRHSSPRCSGRGWRHHPPVGGVDDDLTDDETRFYVDTFVTAMVRRASRPCQRKGEYRDPRVIRHLDAEPTDNPEQ